MAEAEFHRLNSAPRLTQLPKSPLERAKRRKPGRRKKKIRVAPCRVDHSSSLLAGAAITPGSGFSCGTFFLFRSFFIDNFGFRSIKKPPRILHLHRELRLNDGDGVNFVA
ncbi:hypothetical protein GE061_006854 [Apolygus lucorum]|uniref:Uncharacterized protein n=1 Tax=Apolygus lucorum TaxID=248454 RepID=A0A8S9WRU4_APOLU|nr:hypothetical protein GE061_006854 [Apolygus lucorum]